MQQISSSRDQVVVASRRVPRPDFGTCVADPTSARGGMCLPDTARRKPTPVLDAAKRQPHAVAKMLGTYEQFGMWPMCSGPTIAAPPLLKGVIGSGKSGYGYRNPHGWPKPMRWQAMFMITTFSRLSSI